MSNEPTIAEKNRAICEFMGWEFKELQPDWYHVFHEGNLMWADNLYAVQKTLLEGFNYHKDWNRLMEVIKKVREMHADLLLSIKAGIGDYIKAAREMNRGLITCDINKAHSGVYKFLQWYNKQQSNE